MGARSVVLDHSYRELLKLLLDRHDFQVRTASPSLYPSSCTSPAGYVGTWPLWYFCEGQLDTGIRVPRLWCRGACFWALELKMLKQIVEDCGDIEWFLWLHTLSNTKWTGN